MDMKKPVAERRLVNTYLDVIHAYPTVASTAKMLNKNGAHLYINHGFSKISKITNRLGNDNRNYRLMGKDRL